MTTMDALFEGYEKRLALLTADPNPLASGIAYVAGEMVPLTEARVPMMDQGFLHSDLTYDVMPVTELDGAKIGGGQVGPITRAIWEAYWDLHYDPKLSFAIAYQ